MTFLVECAYCGAGECNCGAKEYTARLIAPPALDIDWKKPKTPRPEPSDRGELVQKDNIDDQEDSWWFIIAGAILWLFGLFTVFWSIINASPVLFLGFILMYIAGSRILEL